MKKKYAITGAILAGGENRRMGTDKAFLKLGDFTFLEWVYSAISKVCEEVFIITDDPTKYLSFPANVVQDLIPKKGPLGALYTALFFSSTSHTILCPIDTPLIHPEVLVCIMGSCSKKHDIVLPRTPDGTNPLHGVYSQKVIGKVEEYIMKGNLQVRAIFPHFRVHEVLWEEFLPFDKELRSFWNINTPEDLSQVTDFITIGKFKNFPIK